MYKLIFLVLTSVIAGESPSPNDPGSPPHQPPSAATVTQTPHSPSPSSTPRYFTTFRYPSSILRESNEIYPDGSYQWSYETSNGISAEEKGTPLNIPEAPIGVTGNFKYESWGGGGTISLSYVADENGFRPVGNHLPVAPPIPPLIARALEWIAAHPEKKE